MPWALSLKRFCNYQLNKFLHLAPLNITKHLSQPTWPDSFAPSPDKMDSPMKNHSLPRLLVIHGPVKVTTGPGLDAAPLPLIQILRQPPSTEHKSPHQPRQRPAGGNSTTSTQTHKELDTRNTRLREQNRGPLEARDAATAELQRTRQELDATRLALEEQGLKTQQVTSEAHEQQDRLSAVLKEARREVETSSAIAQMHLELNARLHNHNQELSEARDAAAADLQRTKQELEAALLALEEQGLEAQQATREVHKRQDSLRDELRDARREARSQAALLGSHKLQLDVARSEIDRLVARARREADSQAALSRDHKLQLDGARSEIDRLVAQARRDADCQATVLEDHKLQLDGARPEIDRLMAGAQSALGDMDQALDSGVAAQVQQSPGGTLGDQNEELGSLRSALLLSQGTASQLEAENQALSEKVTELKENVQMYLKIGYNATEECKELRSGLEEVKAVRRIYLEKFLSLRGAIRVMCRIRGDPSANRDPVAGVRVEISQDTDGASLTVSREVESSLGHLGLNKSPTESTTTWKLDQVFSSTDDNDAVWEEVRPLLESAMDGAQVVIILFGRTGTGKSWTSDAIWARLGNSMFAGDEADTEEAGEAGEAGEAEPAESELVSPQDCGEEECTRLWAVEIYLSELFDLLQAPQAGGRRTKKLETPKTGGTLHPVAHCGASLVRVVDRAGLKHALSLAALRRRSAQTNANDKSSRSHSFTSLELPGGGSITLVDLAGHEKASSGGSQDEAIAINSSLGALVQALGQLKAAQRGQTRQRATTKSTRRISSGKKSSKALLTGKSAPGQMSPVQTIEGVWSSPELLPRIVGAVMLRGSGGQRDGELELKSKVMFMATVDFATMESTMGSKATLEVVQNLI